MSTLLRSTKLKANIGPSLLAADLARISEESLKILGCGANSLHLDVMDGHFVPNLTFGAPVIKCLRKNVPSNTFLDVHLMVSNPLQWIDDMADAGANMFTFHCEANGDINEIISLIKKKGMQVGLAVKPGTPITDIIEYIPILDMVLVMTVEPGFGGQKFQPEMMNKVKLLREKFPYLNIQVDGGLSPSTIDIAAQAGANWIVAGSSVFKAENPTSVITNLRQCVEKVVND